MSKETLLAEQTRAAPQAPVTQRYSAEEFACIREALAAQRTAQWRDSLSARLAFDARNTPAPERFVVAGTEQPPASRCRLVAELVLERWHAVAAVAPAEASLAEAARAALTVAGWRVTQERIAPYCDCENPTFSAIHGFWVHQACDRPVPLKHPDESPDEFRQRILSLQVQVDTDTLYEGFYPTIPGNDIIRFDKRKLAALRHTDSDRRKMEAWRGNDVLYSRADDPANANKAIRPRGAPARPLYKGPATPMRGGTYIKSRADWRQKTKDMVLYDKGVWNDWDRVRAQRKQKVLNKALELERKIEGQLREIAVDD
jgi:hypothetical protein